MKKLTLLAIMALLIGNFQWASAQEDTQKQVDYRYTGELNKEDLLNSPMTYRWFAPKYESFKADEVALKTIKKHINDYDIVMFMGTWCPDSHREVPRVYKILDETGYDMDHLKVYALAHGMVSKSGEEKGKNITNVPTLIFYKDGKEVNRFVEHPRESLEKDIAKIVSGEPYQNYHFKDAKTNINTNAIKQKEGRFGKPVKSKNVKSLKDQLKK